MNREEAIKHGRDQLKIFGGDHKKFIIAALDALLEPRYGEWIPYRLNGEKEPDQYICSECHVSSWNKTRYCSNCGAKMA